MHTMPMDEPLERLSPVARLLKRGLVDPIGNYAPAGLLRGLLRFGKSELAASNWADPGGWRSMVISYRGQSRQIADKVLLGGAMSRALRNRRRLAARLLRDVIEQGPTPAHLLCLGAGPGMIATEAMAAARKPSRATLVDLSAEAFAFGQQLAAERGLADRVRFIQGDVRDVRTMLDEPPTVVKMIGICEYLSDAQIIDIAQAVAAVMPAGAPIVFNSLSTNHGNDRFFRRVFGLHMVHREAGALCDLMGRAGFEGFVAHPEPLGVYQVVVGLRGQAQPLAQADRRAQTAAAER